MAKYNFTITYSGMHNNKQIVTEDFTMAYEYALKTLPKGERIVGIGEGEEVDQIITKTHPM